MPVCLFACLFLRLASHILAGAGLELTVEPRLYLKHMATVLPHLQSAGFTGEPSHLVLLLN